MTTEQHHDWVKQVAEHLDGWEYDEHASKALDGSLLMGAAIVGPEGRSIWIGRNQGRANVSVNWPKKNGAYMSARDWGAVEYGEKAPSISVKQGRDPVAVAREIKRRFLPDFEPVWAKLQERINYCTEYRQGVKSKNEALMDFPCVTREDNRDPDRGRFDLGRVSDGYWGSMEVYGTGIDISLKTLTLEKAKEVLRALGG